MSKPIITLKMRFEYLRGILNEINGLQLTYPEFMEAVFTKLEQEIRSNSSMLDSYHKEQIKTINQEDFEYDYDK
ncbi:MAG: hypothetical protein PHY56_04865 [Candidatus Omnitrophica bacterium]|nr:hypothetical protein [Candidatus Omnitrophota bacterium]